MNKSRLIWGTICLLIAGGLSVANLSLPSANVMFQIGDQNMPWVPVGVLALLGIWLLATSGRPIQPGSGPVEVREVADPDRSAVNKRLEGIAWGLFLMMLGGFMFVPEELVGKGWWSIGIGLIMLGLNAARYFTGLKMSGFTTFLGTLSLLGGVLEVSGIYDVDGAIFLIILGAYLVLKPYIEKRGLFGKAEQA